MAWLAERCGIGARPVVADIAAGTGKLTRADRTVGATLVAVEPVDRDARAFAARCARRARWSRALPKRCPSRDGSLDAITVAQAFHWFDAGARCASSTACCARVAASADLERP